MNKYFTAALLFFIFSLIYYTGSFAKIPFADCVGFVILTEKGQFMTVATATTHFLYINSAIVLKNITNLNAIEANRLLVILSASATVSIIYATIRNIVVINWVAITGAFVFGFSFSFWKNAEIIEVYTYNTLWISLFFFCMVKNFTQKSSKYIIFSGLILGISLWLHIQNILLIPAFLLFLFYFKNDRKAVYISFSILFIFLIMLSIINYSQGLSPMSPYSSDQGSWVQNSFKKTFSQYFFDLIKSIFYLVYNFNIFTFFGIAGAIALYKMNAKMFLVFFTASVTVYGFSTFYAVSDNYVFFLPFNLIFALSIGYGLSLQNYSFFKKVSWISLLIPFLYYVSFKTVTVTKKGQSFDDFKKYKGGLEYYMLPWMNNNVGILEFTIDKKIAPEPINWMTASAEEYIHILKSKGYTPEQIRKL